MSRRDAEAALAAIERIGARLLCWGEPLYPAALAAVEDAPPVLTMLGRPEMILAPMVAVVGARNASANGRRLAHVPGGPRRVEVRSALNNSFGFGGHNASLVFTAADA